MSAMALFGEGRPKVIIVGGGAAGIGAARTLYQAGLDPIVLEAQDRIGGRMRAYQMRPNLIKDEMNNCFKDSVITIQLGANWIHGLNEEINPMYKFAQNLGLRLQQTSSDDEPGDDVLLFDNIQTGKVEQYDENAVPSAFPAFVRVSKDDYFEVLKRYKWIRDNFEVYSTSLGKHDDISVQTAFDACIQASERVFGPFCDLHRRCFHWLLDRVAIDMGRPLSRVHKMNYSEGDSCGLFGEAMVIDGGYFSILEHLAHEFPLNIHFNSSVTRIEHRTDSSAQNFGSVTVHCENGSIYDGDFCIITASLGVLQSQQIDFVPTIPRCIKTLDCRLEMGLMNLVWLWFPHVFWPKNFNFFGVTRGNNTEENTKFTTFLAPTILDSTGKPQAILMCQVVGGFSERLESMSEEEVAQAAMVVLKSMFSCDMNNIIPDPIGCKHSCWKSDKYAGGSWSHFAMKSDYLPYCQELDHSPEPILYAGEAANAEFRGTVHGAYLSGVDQAEKILRTSACHCNRSIFND